MPPIGQAVAEPSFEDREVEAEYTLEYPVICPCCDQVIKVVEVVRLLRTKVHFTSTLPRRGRMIVCPSCNKVLSAELAGFA
jgi:hypothetical protein